jgi:GT2 family glycosyltransferase
MLTICIATHDRRDDLARTLGEIARLDPQPAEIIVCADGCSDGTADFLKREHPAVRLIVHAEPRGSIPSRNEMAAACTSELFLSLDDDSYPIEPDFIARVEKLFAESPALAVAAFPQRTDEFPDTIGRSDFGPPHFAGTFANSGAAIRRSAFMALGGYPDFFGHAYEEPDFALRCVAAGWQVRHETALTVRHHFTPMQRDELRTHHRHARNELWSVVLRCPSPHLIAVALFRVARQAGYAASRGWLLREPLWWGDCIDGIARCIRERRPIPWEKYCAWMQLVRRPIFNEDEWRARFGNAGQAAANACT